MFHIWKNVSSFGKIQSGPWLILLACLQVGFASNQETLAGQLYVGGATVSITPDGKVMLDGHRASRVSNALSSPITATALAVETRNADESLEQAVFVSCDLISIRGGILEKLKEKLADKAQGLDLNKIIVNGTHTHIAPVMTEGKYDAPEGIITPTQYVEFATDQLAAAVLKAWNDRKPGKVGWGLGHAVVAYNRRAVYADGSAQMYGKTDRADFRGIEGPEDQGLEILFFWDQEDKLIATCINVASPSQILGGRALGADFWHQTRERIRKKYGQDLLILAWTGAAGDQAPRPMFRVKAEERMRKLRGLSEVDVFGERIANAWEETYEAAQKEKFSDVPFRHVVETISLTPRKISESDYQKALKGLKEAEKNKDGGWARQWNGRVLERYRLEQEGKRPPEEMTLHVVRLGDIAIATNTFEYFTDYGVQIKARGKAIQTFVIQLAGSGSYIPTEKAVAGGGYSAEIQSNRVGPEGGQELVDRTVELINSFW